MAAVGALAAVVFLAARPDALDELKSLPGNGIWGEMTELASGEAVQGPWRMNESDFRYLDDPTIAFTPDGHKAVVWVDQGAKSVRFGIYDSDNRTWITEPREVSQTPDTFSWLPRMIVDGQTVHLLWQEIIFSGGSHGGEILYARSDNGGNRFSEPVNLSQTQAGAGKGRLSTRRWDNGSLDLESGGEGSLYAVWTEYEGALRISRSGDGGETFGEPLQVAGSDRRPARAPSLAVDSEGVLHLVWSRGEDRSADIMYAYSADGGDSFSDPVPLHPGDAHADAPALRVDGDDRLHLVYMQSNGSGNSVYYSHREPSEETFSGPVKVSDDHAGQVRGAGWPDLALDDEGRMVVIWELYPARSAHSAGFGYTWSDDGGRSFYRPAAVPGTVDSGTGIPGSLQGSLMRRLQANAGGELAFVYSTFSRGESSHIHFIPGSLPQE